MANWRTAFKSDFLASWDLDSNVTLTIKTVEVKEVQLAKKEVKVIANFVDTHFPNGEIIKPMVLNATNCKKMNTFTGTKETSQWNNIVVEIGVVANTGRIGAANGLAILRVISGGVDRLQQIKDLYKEVSDNLTPEEIEGVERVIANQEQNAYDKTFRFLTSKQAK